MKRSWWGDFWPAESAFGEKLLVTELGRARAIIAQKLHHFAAAWHFDWKRFQGGLAERGVSRNLLQILYRDFIKHPFYFKEEYLGC